MKRFDFIVDSDEHGQQHQLQRIESDTGEYVLQTDAQKEVLHLREVLQRLMHATSDHSDVVWSDAWTDAYLVLKPL